MLTAALLVAGTSSILAVTAFGCAMSAPADLTPDLDPSLPGLDAASDPHPAPGSQNATPQDGGSSGNTPTDSGAKALAPDSGSPTGPVDSGPPPPAKPGAGEVLITEIMYTTTTPEPASEWIELYNAATTARSLGGLVLKDGGGRTHLISQAVVIAPGAYIVLARSKAGSIAAKVPSAAIAYEYGTGLGDSAGILLANGATGGISLMNGVTTVADAPYGGWFTQSGGDSIQLKLTDGTQQSVKAGWCLSATTWTSGSDKGTPGTPSNCP